jgi:hypothetical protein
VPKRVEPLDGHSDCVTTQIAQVLGSLLISAPGVSVSRLVVKFPADDDNLWFIRQHQGGPELQIECGPDGRPPFVIESDRHDARHTAATVADALDVIREWLAEATRLTTSDKNGYMIDPDNGCSGAPEA